MRGPGIHAGSVETTATTHIDLAPTLLKLAGVELRGDFDGTPIPVQHKSDSIHHEHVAVEYWGIAIAEGEIGGFGTLPSPLPPFPPSLSRMLMELCRWQGSGYRGQQYVQGREDSSQRLRPVLLCLVQ